ncbi:hypothetical protein ACEU6E_10205 [Halorutilales archaeon Cl-col2-1]
MLSPLTESVLYFLGFGLVITTGYYYAVTTLYGVGFVIYLGFVRSLMSFTGFAAPMFFLVVVPPLVLGFIGLGRVKEWRMTTDTYKKIVVGILLVGVLLVGFDFVQPDPSYSLDPNDKAEFNKWGSLGEAAFPVVVGDLEVSNPSVLPRQTDVPYEVCYGGRSVRTFNRVPDVIWGLTTSKDKLRVDIPGNSSEIEKISVETVDSCSSTGDGETLGVVRTD